MDPLILIPITAVFVLGLVLGRRELIKRRLTCPRTGTVEEVGVVQKYAKPGEPTGVASCTLMPDAKKVDCEVGCLDQVRETDRGDVPVDPGMLR